MAEWNDPGIELEKKTDELEELKERLILQQTASFTVEYNLKTRKYYIDPSYKNYIKEDWEKDFIRSKEMGRAHRRAVLRQDHEMLDAFFDFSTLKAGDKRIGKARFRIDKHQFEWFRMALFCAGGADGEPERVVITFSNVQREIEAMEKVEFLLSQDPLTHLPNRSIFIKKTQRMLKENPKKLYAFVQMDVDKFHMVNQFFGAKEGDNILRYLGVKIQECMEAMGECTYCRVSSDTFCLCMPDDQEGIDEAIEYIQSSLRSYPIRFDTTMSFGIYMMTERDHEKNESIETMMDRARAAQRTVKGNYMKRVAVYNEEFMRQEEMEQMIVSEMKQALREEQFKVYLQPKCDMETGRIIGSEALVRWHHPKHGMISPGKFVPIFERNGFISEVDYYVMENTCRTIRRWLDEGFPVEPVSVNVSRMDMYNPRLMENIKDCVSKYNVPHELIEFELTESAFVFGNAQRTNLAERLQENHFSVLMDDFGSGYSSLNSLREISVDILKIDLKFLPQKREDTRANVILSCIIDMANKLGLEVIVEGVENISQVKFLLSIGCKNAQGFYFHRPMSIDEFEKCMKAEPVPISMRERYRAFRKQR